MKLSFTSLILILCCTACNPTTEEDESTYTLVDENETTSPISEKGINFDKLDFMVGVWLDNSTMIEKTGIQYLEKWRSNPDDSYSCQSYQIEPVIDRTLPDYMRNGARVTKLKEDTQELDTIYSEKVTIATKNGVTYYNVTVFNQNSGKTISFALTEARENFARFENPNHDFPQVIQYHRTHSDTLRVLIGSVDGQKKQDLTYVRVK
ncbi:MAG: DUF6265 family protein [Flavobacteriales bacterium]